MSKARAKAKSRGDDEKWEWAVKPGERVVVRRTVILISKQLTRKEFRTVEEALNIYTRMLEITAPYASRNMIENHYRLKDEKYHELRRMYKHAPSHYVHGVCRDATNRVLSLKKNKTRHYTHEIFEELVKHLGLNSQDLMKSRRLRKHLWGKAREIARYQVDLEMRDGILVPRINNVSMWLVDDRVWKPLDVREVIVNDVKTLFFTKVAINTHRGWVNLELEPTKHFYKLLSRGFKPTSHARLKLDRRNRRVLFYLTLEKEVEIYKPERPILKPVDVNENSVATLYEGLAIVFESELAKTTLGYYYRRKSIQERHGSKSVEARRAMRKLREGRKKKDYRRKIANLIVRDALRVRGVIVVERISGDDVRVMIVRFKDRQLRHRIYQSALKGEINEIIDKAREYGVPVLMVDPENTSKECPIHKAPIKYERDRIGVCSKGGEMWHREVVALINIYLRGLEALNEGYAQKGFESLNIDGSPLQPLGSTATLEPIGIHRSLWGRWKSLDDHRDTIKSLWLSRDKRQVTEPYL